MFVWRLKTKIIRTALSCNMYDRCAQPSQTRNAWQSLACSPSGIVRKKPWELMKTGNDWQNAVILEKGSRNMIFCWVLLVPVGTLLTTI